VAPKPHLCRANNQRQIAARPELKGATELMAGCGGCRKLACLLLLFALAPEQDDILRKVSRIIPQHRLLL
jgi:hypothetical protein